MRPSDISLAHDLQEKLLSFNEQHLLAGINNPQRMHCFIMQIIDSIRRIEYVRVVLNKNLSAIYTDATSEYFDPLKASIWHIQHNNLNEAFWLVFLLTHFGKNRRTKWSLVRGIYGAFGHSAFWTWNRIISNFVDFQNWLDENQIALRNVGGFGNHRKYQSLAAFTPTGTGAAIGSYVDWVSPNHDHLLLIANFTIHQNNSRALFRTLYNSMDDVITFGRMARFDYLTMIGKLGLAPIEPDSTYMQGATGPKIGAKLLFGGHTNSPITEDELGQNLNQLEAHLNIYFGMQVLEDALCNWQKNPDNYVHFIG